MAGTENPLFFRLNAMDDAGHTTSASAETATPAPAATRKTPRVSRIVIGVLSIVLVVEAISYGRMTSTHKLLWNEMHAGEREGTIINKARIDAVVGRPPDESHIVKAPVGDERYELYYFRGLLKRRAVCVHYGISGINSEPEVVDVTTTIPDEVLHAE